MKGNAVKRLLFTFLLFLITIDVSITILRVSIHIQTLAIQLYHLPFHFLMHSSDFCRMDDVATFMLHLSPPLGKGASILPSLIGT